MSTQVTWPPLGFSYGKRRESGEMEHHPVLPDTLRTPENLQKGLLLAKRLTIPEIIKHSRCSERTVLGFKIAETLLLGPVFSFEPYKRLFCCTCLCYCDLAEFSFEDGKQVGGLRP